MQKFENTDNGNNVSVLSCGDWVNGVYVGINNHLHVVNVKGKLLHKNDKSIRPVQQICNEDKITKKEYVDNRDKYEKQLKEKDKEITNSNSHLKDSITEIARLYKLSGEKDKDIEQLKKDFSLMEKRLEFYNDAWHVFEYAMEEANNM